jgi:arsenate reductase (thioredoxin)
VSTKQTSAAAKLLEDKARLELHGEFGAVHPAAVIDRIFGESLTAFSAAGVPDYVPTLAQRQCRDRLRALGLVEGTIAHSVPEVVCVGLEGRGRSLMTAALIDLRSDGRAHAVPVGTDATIELDPNVIAAMAEVGIDLTESYARPVSAEVLNAADVVITLGRSVGAIEIPETARHEDWRIGDPVGAPLNEVRRIRRELEARVEELLATLV